MLKGILLFYYLSSKNICQVKSPRITPPKNEFFKVENCFVRGVYPGAFREGNKKNFKDYKDLLPGNIFLKNLFRLG